MGLRHTLPDPVVLVDATTPMRHVLADPVVVCDPTTGLPVDLGYTAAAYGAVADGTTDDSDAIQAAIDAASAAGGGVVEIGEGTYLLEKPLQLKSYVTLRGQGKYGVTVLKIARYESDLAEDAAGSQKIVKVADASSFKAGMIVSVFDQNATYLEANGYAMYDSGSSSRIASVDYDTNTITLVNNIRTGRNYTTADGAYLVTDHSAITCSGLRFTNFHAECILPSCTGSTIENLEIDGDFDGTGHTVANYDESSDGIDMPDGVNCTIRNVYIHDTPMCNITFSHITVVEGGIEGCQYCLVENSHFKNGWSHAAVHCHSWSYGTIQDCIIDNSEVVEYVTVSTQGKFPAFHMSGDRIIARNLRVTADYYGIRVAGGYDCSIIGGTIYSNVNSAIYVSAATNPTSYGLRIIGVSILGTNAGGACGIEIATNFNDTLIEGCKLTGILGTGISTIGNGTIIRGNHVQTIGASDRRAIVVQASGCIVDGNYAEAKYSYAIRIVGPKNTITNNYANVTTTDGNKYEAISGYGVAGALQATGCICTGNRAEGFNLTSSIDMKQPGCVTKNNIDMPKSFACSATPTAANTWRWGAAAYEIPLPASGTLKGFIVTNTIPYSTKAGVNTIKYSIGETVQNADDTVDAGENDIMVVTGSIIAASSAGVAADGAAGGPVAAYYPDRGGSGKVLSGSTPAHVHLNYWAESDAVSGWAAITSTITVTPILEYP